MNKEFWRAALVRAVRTVAQTAVATIGTTAVIEKVNWLTVLSASALAGLLSLLTSIATGLPEVEKSDDRHPPDENDEDKGLIAVLAYDDYYPDGSPKSKDGVMFPEPADEDGEDDADR